MQLRNISVSIIIVSVLVLFFACSTAQPQYKIARKIDTIAAYQEFIRNHPDSELTKAAETRIEEINFEKAKGVNTVSAYEQFIATSDSELFKNYANQLILKIYEDDYKKTKEINSLEAYDTYLEKYPKSIYSTDCSMRIESLIWNKTIKENTAVSYYKYLNNCSACGRHDQEARNRFLQMVKAGVAVDISLVKNSIETILSRNDIVITQKSPKGISTRTGSVRLDNLLDAEEVLVSIATDAQTTSAIDLANGKIESVKKLRLKQRVPGERSNPIGFSTIIIYSEDNGPTDIVFIAAGNGYLFQETGSSIY